MEKRTEVQGNTSIWADDLKFPSNNMEEDEKKPSSVWILKDEECYDQRQYGFGVSYLFRILTTLKYMYYHENIK